MALAPRRKLGTKKQEKQSTRDKLVCAARKLFLQHGYAATSIDHITAECDLTRGVFYNYFDSKQALYDLAFAGDKYISEISTNIHEKDDKINSRHFLPLQFFTLDYSSKQTNRTATLAIKRSLWDLQGCINRDLFSSESALLASLAMQVGAEVLANKIEDPYLVQKIRQACADNLVVGQMEMPFNAEDYFWNTQEMGEQPAVANF